ncbi:MAG: gliding motility lipoprotein GldH [Candidatus Symbiothrix sp.]|jgi:gliding motility-associated lipoprotein GldH|nr:gliding motility lipoprotein GldH [Candidatus Symbiothrix sp.]
MARRRIKFVLLSTAFLLWMACSPDELFSEFHSFPGAKWPRNEKVGFKVESQEEALPQDIFIEIRNSNAYPFRNLWLFIDVTAPDGSRRCDTVNVELADVYGKWHGRGVSLYSTSFLYEANVKYPLPGTYIYSIRQGMRETVLEGITDVGMTVTKR